MVGVVFLTVSADTVGFFFNSASDTFISDRFSFQFLIISLVFSFFFFEILLHPLRRYWNEKIPVEKSRIKRANHFWFRYLRFPFFFFNFSKEIKDFTIELVILNWDSMGAISAEQPSRSSLLLLLRCTHNQNRPRWWRESRVQTITCFSLISCAIPCLPLIIMYQSYAQCHPSRPASCNTKREKSDKRNNNQTNWTCTQTGSLLRERNKTCSQSDVAPLLAMLARLSRFL